jgi:hypothetical protein
VCVKQSSVRVSNPNAFYLIGKMSCSFDPFLVVEPCEEHKDDHTVPPAPPGLLIVLMGKVTVSVLPLSNGTLDVVASSAAASSLSAIMRSIHLTFQVDVQDQPLSGTQSVVGWIGWTECQPLTMLVPLGVEELRMSLNQAMARANKAEEEKEKEVARANKAEEKAQQHIAELLSKISMLQKGI